MGNDGLRGFSYVDTPVGIPFADEVAMMIPKVATFPTWRSGNGGTAVLSDLASGLGVRITCLMPHGDDPSLTYAAVPVVVGSGGWQVTARILYSTAPYDLGLTKFSNDDNCFSTGLNLFGLAGLILRDAASGKSVLFNQNTRLVMTYVASGWRDRNYWLRLKDDLTNWTLYCSLDGNYWQQIYCEARNDYLGTTPTHVGIVVNPNYAAGAAGPRCVTGTPVALDCFSFLFEAL